MNPSAATQHSLEPDGAGEEVTEPRPQDVLGGRGGAALRHPGNITYRQLVNLNKNIYTTCLKTEKLKISRSIVSAINEQGGRFLEKKKGCTQIPEVWVNIGYKKAVEKTSQALREGQPKRREQIQAQVAGGGVVPIVVPTVGGGGAPGAAAAAAAKPAVPATADYNSMPPPGQFQQQQQQQQAHHHHQHDINVSPDELLDQLSLSDLPSTGASMYSIGTPSNGSTPSLPRINRSSRSGGTSNFSMGMLSQLSIMSDFGSPMHNMHPSPHATGQQQQHQHFYPNQNHPSGPVSNTITVPNESLAAMSIMEDVHYGAGGEDDDEDEQQPDRQTSSSDGAAAAAPPPPPNNQQQSQQRKTSPFLDRRHVFAKMKYQRPPSTRRPPGSTFSQHSLNGTAGTSMMSMGGVGSDGMKDFNMVESGLSLFSSISSHMTMTNSSTSTNNLMTTTATTGTGNTSDDGGMMFDHQQQTTTTSSSVAAMQPQSYRGMLGRSPSLLYGSRHSIMSGLSRISDTSMGDPSNIFSDLGRKIENVQ